MKHSRFLDLLPIDFAYLEQGTPNTDLDNFLKIFEAIMVATDEELQEEGITDLISFEQTIDNAQSYSDPDAIPYDIFPSLGPWFARCLGIAVQQDWNYYQLKQMIKQILPIYRIRTTAFGLEYLFAILTQYPAQVIEILGDFGIGFYRQPINDAQESVHDIAFCSGRIGTVVDQRPADNMRLGGNMVGNFFIINLTIGGNGNLTQRSASLYQQALNLFNWVQEEKPVQTQFQLNFTTTPMQVGARGTCTLGMNTTLVPHFAQYTMNSWQNPVQILKPLISRNANRQPTQTAH